MKAKFNLSVNTDRIGGTVDFASRSLWWAGDRGLQSHRPCPLCGGDRGAPRVEAQPHFGDAGLRCDWRRCVLLYGMTIL